MCGTCARMGVAPRPRVPGPVQAGRPPVAVPIARAASNQPAPVPAAQPAAAAAVAPTAPGPIAVDPQTVAPSVSPWVANRTHAAEPSESIRTIEMGARHDSGLLRRGVHTQAEED